MTDLSQLVDDGNREGQAMLQPNIDWQRYALILEQTARAARVSADAELRKMRQERDTFAVAAAVFAFGLAMMTVLVIALWRMG